MKSSIGSGKRGTVKSGEDSTHLVEVVYERALFQVGTVTAHGMKTIKAKAFYRNDAFEPELQVSACTSPYPELAAC
jgi:hypothetical protein